MQPQTPSSSVSDSSQTQSERRRRVGVESAGQSALQQAIARAEEALLALQHPEGYWHGELIVDATLCADLIFYMWQSGRMDPVLVTKCAQHILGKRLADGGWALYEGGSPELNATLKCYVALCLAGETRGELAREADFIRHMGGCVAASTYVRFWLALLGLLPWRELPSIPPEIILLPRSAPFHLGRLSAWSRVILVPMSVLWHYQPAPAITPGFDIGELHAPNRRKSRGRLAQLPFRLLDRAIKAAEDIGAMPLREAALKAAELWMIERMGEGSDGLGAVFPSMLNALMAFRCLGYAETHPLMQKARSDFEKLYVEDEKGFRIQPCFSPVWDTAIAMIALARSSADGAAQAVAKGYAWLFKREVRYYGDWAMDNPGVEPGGWAFEFRNVFYPDIDDTAMVLIAFARAGLGSSARSVCWASERAFRWIMRMQCRDGGWAAFDRDVMDPWLEHVPFADHNAILDPSCSDVTARVLEAVGAHGLQRRYSNEVSRAVSYLRSTQEKVGCWYGRWGVNYLYGTWQVLRGLYAIQWDMTEVWVQKAADWLKACQNPDGGWGESPRSYEDREAWGKGPSTPSQTAWAIMGLCAAGHGGGEAVRKGVRYLIETQRPDGWWDEYATTGTGFPRVFYLKYDLYRLAWPLIALREYAVLRKYAHQRADWHGTLGIVS